MDIQRENNLIKEAFEVEADEIGFCLDQKWGDYENPYENSDTALAFNLFKKGWQATKAHESKKLEGFVLVPHGVLDLTRFMCKTWSEIDKFVYKNCSDIGQYPVIQGTQNQLNLSRIGEQQINANEINKGVNWLLEAAQEPAND